MDLREDKLYQTVESFNNTSLDFPNDRTLIDLFSEKVNSFPNELALIYNEKELSYKELDNASNQFANYLIIKHKIHKGDFVGLMLERSEMLIISMLAILKAGAVYVPIDTEYPQSRKEYIKKDSNCKTIIDAPFLDSFISESAEFDSDSLPNINVSPENLVYVIYTSGTTGNPKGVMIKHKSVINLITSQTQCFNIDKTERILLFSNYFFDASVEQIFLALLNGAALVIVDKLVLKNHALPEFIVKNKITHLHATPSYLETLTDLSKATSLKRIIAGGEVCTLKMAEKLSLNCDFYNEYGPTETTVTSTIYKFSSKDRNENSLSIGKPIGNTKAYILSEKLELCPIGEIGELCLSGDGLARGYLNLLELTDEKFVVHPFIKNQKLYRTGDFAKWHADGNLEIIGRKDDQVKIRGYRIELGEIEAAINTVPNVKRAVVTANSETIGEKRLVAYVQSENETQDTLALRKSLSEVIPEYMVPTIFIWMEEFPTTPNGKIDKKKLPNPINSRPDSAPILKKPRNKVEKDIAKIWSEQLYLSEIGIDDNFFELGGTSLLTQKVSTLIKENLNLEVPVTKIYQYPTIASLSQFLNIDNQKPKPKRSKKQDSTKESGDVAVIGMAGKFPGASSIQELWDVLKEGKETISFFSPDELDKSIPEALRTDPLYVGARGIIQTAKEFDSQFFGINPKLAETMDPQQRLFLEIAWEVLEQSGHLPKHYDGSIGVYAGVNTNTYYIKNVIPNEEAISRVGGFQVNTVNDKDFVASRAAYHLNLKGPAVSVHSACSTSLLAIAEAVEALRSGQCDVAIAGAASVTAPVNSGHLYQEGSMLSSDGHCRSFDAEAKGTVFSDGAAVVLLKNLEDAIEDGDRIYGVVKGVGINNDGGNKGSFTAPSVEGQADAISRALVDSDIDPSKISYIEAHGTATPLGDPIEMEGLRMAFGDQPKNGYCAIGSVKSNMGHLTAAAGAAGFIKTVLAMYHRKIPASLGFENPNPAIDFENSPFYVNNKLSDWESDDLRKAGISSFGVGGTNVHIIVEEFINEEPAKSTDRPLQLMTWSAKSEISREGYKTALGNFIKNSKDIKLADIACSLSATRDAFSKRSFVVANDSENASDQLLSEATISIKSSDVKVVPNHLAFLFPGQGAQYLQMGKALYEHEIVFREAVNQCSDILLEALNFDIRTIIYPESNSPEAESVLKDTQFTQPALFVVEYALAQLWMSWGIHPTLLCGHSIGEFVAAHLAGIFNLKDALLLVAVRGKLVSNLPGGSMLSVRATYDSVSKILPETLSMAAVNSDQLCVVSGEDKAIEEFAKTLEEKEIPNRLLLTSHAFHSTMMDPVLEEFESEVRKVTLNIPRIPIISTVTGKWLSDAEATDPKYWTDHLRATVRFSEAMETAFELEDIVLLEVGPGRALTTLSLQKKKTKSASAISSLVFPGENENSYHTVLSALGQLWLKGIEPDWTAFYKGQSRQKVWLPAYVFDRKPCWLEAPTTISTCNTKTSTNDATENIIIKPKQNPVEIKMRKPVILQKISEIVVNNSGIEIESDEYDLSFLELGLDSLVLTQMAITCKNKFSVPITFRQLNGEFGTPDLLAEHLDKILPEETYAPQVSVNIADSEPIPQQPLAVHPVQNSYVEPSNGQNPALNLISQQLQLLGQQIQLMQGNVTMPSASAANGVQVMPNTVAQANSKTVSPTIVNKDILSEDEKKEHQKPFGASPKIDKQAIEVDQEQRAFLDKLTTSYNTKTAKSKAYAQHYRATMADPRVVTGFKPLTKELVYPLVIEKSAGNKLWDLDGNQYMDVLNGFGSCLFGHQPDFIKEALHHQVEQGFEVGPQHPLAGEVCELLCEFTGLDRAALCNTGSEAVLGAMRIARTVTGRSLIVAFSRSYHGINDEVIVRGSKKMRTFPAAPGILPEAVQNMLILDYGTEESLAIIKERAHEIAAVLVEPVQSRRPEFQPIEFLKEVRKITKASETVLIFDEIITGFRMHPGGAQALFGIKADIATYGKVIGGGISIGAILGERKYMDALDGGFWQYGDDSFPEVGVTYFAGTFVRHPLALATAKASLIHMKKKSGELQDSLAALTDRLASELNSYFKENGLPMEINYYRSLWRLAFTQEIPYSELLFVLMREKGIHIWDGFPCYMTEVFTENDIDQLVRNFIISIEELIAVDIFKPESTINNGEIVKHSTVKDLNKPPVNGARLGIDKEGNPAWFIIDEKNDGEYLRIDL